MARIKKTDLDDLFSKPVQEALKAATGPAQINAALDPDGPCRVDPCMVCGEFWDIEGDVPTQPINVCLECEVFQAHATLDALESKITDQEERLAHAWSAFDQVVAAASQADQDRYANVNRKRVEGLTNPTLAGKVGAGITKALAAGDGLSAILVAEQELLTIASEVSAALADLNEVFYQAYSQPESKGWQIPQSVIDRRLALGHGHPVALEIAHCRSCDAEIVWGLTANGKKCPFDVAGGKATTTSHFTTCPNAGQWSKRKPQTGAAQPIQVRPPRNLSNVPIDQVLPGESFGAAADRLRGGS